MQQVTEEKPNLFNGVKIIVAAPLFPPEIETIANYAKDLAARLKEKNQVTILAYSGQVEDMPGVNVFTVNKRLPLFFRIIKYFIKLNQLARSADIIYVQNAVAAGLPAVLVKIFTGKPVVINFAEDETWKRARHLRLTGKSWEQFLAEPKGNKKINTILKLQIWVLRQADKIIVSSQALARAVSKAYDLPPDKVAVNYSVADRPLQLPFDQPIAKHQILVAGQLFAWCGVEEIIRAVNILKNKFGDIKLVITGDGPAKKDLQKLAKELGLERQVDFRGWVSKAEAVYLLNTSEIVVDNAQNEDFSDWLRDCKLADKIVVTANRDYATEILGEQAIIIDSNKPEAIAEKISLTFGNKAGQKGHDARFTWFIHINRLEEIFNEVL